MYNGEGVICHRGLGFSLCCPGLLPDICADSPDHSDRDSMEMMHLGHNPARYQRAESTGPHVGTTGSRNGRMNKKDLSERHICSKFIGPAKYLPKRAIMMIR